MGPKMVVLKHIWEKTIGLLLPAHCVGCGAHGSYRCAACAQAMPRLEAPLCPSCGMPGWSTRCAACWQRPPAVDWAAVTLSFEGLARTAVHQLKYRNLQALAPAMATLMAEGFHGRVANADALVPVPLHPHQLRRRGYNQSRLLATHLGWLLGVSVWNGALRRVVQGQPQVTVQSREERWSNAAGAFEAVTGSNALQGRDLLLVDDVMTTGSTLHSAATALKAVGVRSVGAVVFAREV